MVPIETFVVDTQKPIIDSIQPSGGSILTTFNSLRAVIKDSTIISTDSLSRLFGPFGIDYSKLRAKGTLQ